MWFRFQIGSKSPLAKRNARMFCAASLPRKWSIRKICSSSNISCSCAFRSRRDCKVGAERLLHDDPAALDEVRLAEQPDHRERRLGRDAEVVQAAQLLGPELGLGLRDRVAQRLGAAAPCAQCRRLANSSQPLGSGPLAAELLDGLRAKLEKDSSVELVERGPTTRNSGSRPACDEVQQAGQQLAPGEVAGRPEEDDGRGCVHGSSLLPVSRADQSRASGPPGYRRRPRTRGRREQPRPGAALYRLNLS